MFEIDGTNFNSYTTDMSIYEINWRIDPPLEDKYQIKTLNSGQAIEVPAGSWLENTEFTVSAELTFIEEPKIFNDGKMNFKTYAPPKNG